MAKNRKSNRITRDGAISMAMAFVKVDEAKVGVINGMGNNSAGKIKNCTSNRCSKKIEWLAKMQGSAFFIAYCSDCFFKDIKGEIARTERDLKETKAQVSYNESESKKSAKQAECLIYKQNLDDGSKYYRSERWEEVPNPNHPKKCNHAGDIFRGKSRIVKIERFLSDMKKELHRVLGPIGMLELE